MHQNSEGKLIARFAFVQNFADSQRELPHPQVLSPALFPGSEAWLTTAICDRKWMPSCRGDATHPAETAKRWMVLVLSSDAVTHGGAPSYRSTTRLRMRVHPLRKSASLSVTASLLRRSGRIPPADAAGSAPHGPAETHEDGRNAALLAGA